MPFLGLDSLSWFYLSLAYLLAMLYALIRCPRAPFAQILGVQLCALIALIATVLGGFQSFVGPPMAGLLMGICLVNLVPDGWFSAPFRAGTAFCAKQHLNLGIVFMGATLSFAHLFRSVYALPLVCLNILLAFAISRLVGRRILGLSENVCILVGGGTAICGGSAIAALSPIIGAREDETAYALTSIFLFDLVACLSFPYLALRLDLSPIQFGFLAGSAINDTASAVAAQETFAGLMGLEGYTLPSTIKLVRTTMIIALALVFSLRSVRAAAGTATAGSGPALGSLAATAWRAFPKFILVFLAMVTLNTALSAIPGSGALTAQLQGLLKTAYKFFITVALVGVGFKIKFRDLFTKGLGPMFLGGCAWFGLFCSSLFFCLFAANLLNF